MRVLHRAIALLVLFAAPAFAGEELEREFCPGVLAPTLETVNVQSLYITDLQLYGRFYGSAEEAFLGDIASQVTMKDGVYHLYIQSVDVPERYRRRGIQNVLFSELLRKVESVYGPVRWDVANLVDTNSDAFFQALLERLKPRYPKLKMPPLPDVEPGTPGYKAFWANAFDDCCRDQLSWHTDEMRALLWDAFRETPAYRTRARLGFGKLCPGTRVSLDYRGSVSLELCR
jgi:hypothetical protein